MATKKSTQIKNGAIYMLPVVASNLFPLLTLPIFTRILTPEDYGVWGLAQVYAAFVNGVANFGLTIGYERNFFENKNPEKRAGLLYSTILFVFSAFIIFGILTYLFKDPLSEWIIGSSNYANILFWTYCATGLMGLKTYFLIYFKNTENAKANTKYTIIDSILVVLTSLFFVAYLRIGVLGLVWGQLLASLTTLSILSVVFIRSTPFIISFKSLKASLKISLPLTPRIFFGIIGKQFDKYMIGLLNTVGGVGVYNIGMKIARIVFAYMTAIENVFAPQVYMRMFDQGEEGRKSIGVYLTPFLYISIIVGLLVSLFSEEIIMILTPRSYYGAIDIVAILSLLYGTYFFGKIPQLVYKKKTYIISILTLLSIGINVGINIPFIYQWGAIGAAWGTFSAGLISGIIYFIVSQHYYKIHWEYGKIASIFLIFFLSTITLIMLRFYEVDYLVRFLFKLLAFSIYIILGIKLNILTKQSLILIKTIFIPQQDPLLNNKN